MSSLKLPLTQKVAYAIRGVGIVMRKPVYIAVAAISSIIFFEVIFWFNNLALLQYILTTPNLSVLAKLDFIFSTYTSIWQSLSSVLAINLLVISFVQGAIVSCLVYVLRKQRQSGAMYAPIGKTGLAGIFAILGLGCAACGTSVLTPLLGLFLSNVSIALTETTGVAISILGLLFAVYALYSIGLKVTPDTTPLRARG